MYDVKDNILKISVRNLVEFIYRSGDIDSGDGTVMDVRIMQEGARIHRKLQKAAGVRYHAEVPLKCDTALQCSDGYEYVVQVEGRADGIICDMDEDEDGRKVPIGDVTIDEIKTTRQDVGRMKEPVYVHKAQAMCYGYIYLNKHKLDKINIRLTYCNPETEEINAFDESMSAEAVNEWFGGLMASFKRWSDYVFDTRRKRQASIEKLEFPFEYRKGQRNLVVGVYRAIEQEKNLFIQASTGVGKTISTIYPAVMAMGQDMADKIFYLTSKTITRTVADDTFRLMRDKGLEFGSVIITAKEKICTNERCECTPKECPMAKEHYDRVNDAVYAMITENRAIDRDVVRAYAEKFNVCPFELELDATYWCDGIICDYNYVFDPNVALKRYFASGAKNDYIFLVDEAHNLVDRAREMYSAEVVKEHFMEVKRMLASDKISDKKLTGALERVNKKMLELKHECDTYRVLGGAESLGRLPEYLERLGSQIQDFLDKNRGYAHRDKLLELFFETNHFLNMYDCLDEKYVIYTEHDEHGDFVVKLFCADPSTNLSDRLMSGRSTVFFSATLLPVNFFKEMLTGNAEDYAVYAESSFPRERRCVVIGKDVSSRYTRRTEAEYRKICGYIDATVEARSGKYMIFFPSYAYMRSVYDMYVRLHPDANVLEFDEIREAGINVIVQRSDMREREKEWFLDVFNDKAQSVDAAGESSLIGFCVAGGIFSEGIDLRDESLIGAIIVVVWKRNPTTCRLCLGGTFLSVEM